MDWWTQGLPTPAYVPLDQRASGVSAFDRFMTTFVGGGFFLLLIVVVLLAAFLPWERIINGVKSRFAARRPSQPGRRGRSYTLGNAFGAVWPDAPDEIVTWVARLNDVQFADVYAWANALVAAHDTRGLDGRDFAIGKVEERGEAPADVVSALRRMRVADFRKLLTVMERA
jgi:hypothetical protein